MFIRYRPWLIVTEESKNRAWTESTALDWTREINRREKREKESESEVGREREQTSILFFSCSLLFHVRACSRFRPHIFAVAVRYLREVHLKMGAVIFGLCSQLRGYRPNDFYLLFLSCVPRNSFSVWVSFSHLHSAADFLLIHFYS